MQRREPYATCSSSVSVGGNKRRILPTVLHSIRNCQDLQLSGFSWFFFLSSVRTMGSKKSFKKADRQMRDRSPFSSNCLVIGSGFHFPTIALAGGEEDRCGLAGTSFLQAGCAVGPGGRSLLAGLWSASHLCSFFPMIDDLVLTRSDLSPPPVLWD